MSFGVERRIEERAHELGADLVGLARAVDVIYSPSARLSAALGSTSDGGDETRPHCPAFAQSVRDSQSRTVLVTALAHPESRPELDWFSTCGNTPGNSALIRITRELALWLGNTEGIETRWLHYQVNHGGMFLKDAAVLAGLGCIGLNNLLVTPQYGPRVRLRGLLVDAELNSDGPLAFDPCRDCPVYCRSACSPGALNDAVEMSGTVSLEHLPARDGFYRRSRCRRRLERDRLRAEAPAVVTAEAMESGRDLENDQYPVRSCRLCEFACPVGAG